MGKCSSKLERSDTDTSFHVRGGKPVKTPSSPQPVVKQDSGEAETQVSSSAESSHSGGKLRKRGARPPALQKTNEVPVPGSSSSSVSHEEGQETYHDAAEELPKTPTAPATPLATSRGKTPVPSKFETPIFSPVKDPRSSFGTSTISTTLPGGSSVVESLVPGPTLGASASQKITKAASPLEPEVAKDAEKEALDAKKAREHQTLKAFVELGDNWELVTRDSHLAATLTREVPQIVATPLPEVESELPSEMKRRDTEARVTIESDSPGGLTEPSGPDSPALLLRKEGYTVREEPLATDLDKSEGTLSSQSSSAGSAEYEIIRGPHDEKILVSSGISTPVDRLEEDPTETKHDWSSEDEKYDSRPTYKTPVSEEVITLQKPHDKAELSEAIPESTSQDGLSAFVTEGSQPQLLSTAEVEKLDSHPRGLATEEKFLDTTVDEGYKNINLQSLETPTKGVAAEIHPQSVVRGASASTLEVPSHPKDTEVEVQPESFPAEEKEIKGHEETNAAAEPEKHVAETITKGLQGEPAVVPGIITDDEEVVQAPEDTAVAAEDATVNEAKVQADSVPPEKKEIQALEASTPAEELEETVTQSTNNEVEVESDIVPVEEKEIQARKDTTPVAQEHSPETTMEDVGAPVIESTKQVIAVEPQSFPAHKREIQLPEETKPTKELEDTLHETTKSVEVEPEAFPAQEKDIQQLEETTPVAEDEESVPAQEKEILIFEETTPAEGLQEPVPGTTTKEAELEQELVPVERDIQAPAAEFNEPATETTTTDTKGEPESVPTKEKEIQVPEVGTAVAQPEEPAAEDQEPATTITTGETEAQLETVPALVKDIQGPEGTTGSEELEEPVADTTTEKVQGEPEVEPESISVQEKDVQKPEETRSVSEEHAVETREVKAGSQRVPAEGLETQTPEKTTPAEEPERPAPETTTKEAEVEELDSQTTAKAEVEPDTLSIEEEIQEPAEKTTAAETEETAPLTISEEVEIEEPVVQTTAKEVEPETALLDEKDNQVPEETPATELGESETEITTEIEGESKTVPAEGHKIHAPKETIAEELDEPVAETTAMEEEAKRDTVTVETDIKEVGEKVAAAEPTTDTEAELVIDEPAIDISNKQVELESAAVKVQEIGSALKFEVDISNEEVELESAAIKGRGIESAPQFEVEISNKEVELASAAVKVRETGSAMKFEAPALHATADKVQAEPETVPIQEKELQTPSAAELEESEQPAAEPDEAPTDISTEEVIPDTKAHEETEIKSAAQIPAAAEPDDGADEETEIMSAAQIPAAAEPFRRRSHTRH